MSVASCRQLDLPSKRRTATRAGLVVGLALVVGAPTAEAAKSRTIRELNGEGMWRVVQVYNDVAFVDFRQQVSFVLRRGKPVRVALNGRAVKVPISVRVRSTATGAYGALDGGAVPYTCSADSTIRARATLRVKRRSGGWRVDVRVLRALTPGSPDCGAEDGVVTWPTGGDLLADAFDMRVNVGPDALGRPIRLEWPERINDCSEPFIVGVCGERLAWTGSLSLRR